MTKKERQIKSLKSLRTPRDVLINKNKKATTSCICPHCKNYINIEYSRYCISCGQRLKWRQFYKAEEKKECLEVLIERYQDSKHPKDKKILKKLKQKYREL